MPGLVIEKLASSLPKKALAEFINPPAKQLAPEGSSEYGGVPRSELHAASGSVPGLPSSAASWIAVVGRQKPQCAFSAQQLMMESAVVMLVIAKKRASCDMVSPRETDTSRSAANII